MSGLYLGSLNLFGSMNKNFGTVCTLYCLVILHCYVQFLVCSIDILGEYIYCKDIAPNIFFRIHSFSVACMILIRHTKKLVCYFESAWKTNGVGGFTTRAVTTVQVF